MQQEAVRKMAAAGQLVEMAEEKAEAAIARQRESSEMQVRHP